MFFEENNPSDIPIDAVLSCLKTHFPKVSESEVHFLYHGTYNVYEVTHDSQNLIFRFPDRSLRNESGVQIIKREVETLIFLKEFLTFTIPNPEFISSDPNLPYIGYQKIPGVSLSKLFSQLSTDQSVFIGQQIGKFLSELHDISLTRYYSSFSNAFDWATSSSSFSVSQYMQQHRHQYKVLRTRVFPFLSQLQQEWSIHQFKDFFTLESEIEFLPALCHCDFDTTNILIDPQTYTVTGIIDFEDTRLYDPAVDLLFFNEGEIFLQSILSTYTEYIDPNIRDRMKFLFKTTFLPYILFGLDHDRPDLIQAGIDRLTFLMQNFE